MWQSAKDKEIWLHAKKHVAKGVETVTNKSKWKSKIQNYLGDPMWLEKREKKEHK